jgi:hypothetical protein
VSVELGRRLLGSGAVKQADLQSALLLHVSSGIPLVRALLQLEVVSEQALEEEFARSNVPTLDGVIPLAALMDELPLRLCRALMAIPVRRDARTGTVVVAAVDPFDPHVAEEFAFHLRSSVRVLRGPLSSVEMALSRIEHGEFSSNVIVDPAQPPERSRTPTLRPALGPSPPPASSVEEVDRRRRSRTQPLGPIARPASDAPIPLVRKAGASATVIAETDEDGEPILPLRMSRLPRAPAVPNLSSVDGVPESVPPATSRGPFSPNAPRAPYASLTAILDAMGMATSRDEVIDCLVVGMATIAARVGLFAVKKGAYRGIACNPRLADAAKFRELSIGSNVASIFATAASAGSYLGPLPATAPHEGFRRILQTSNHEVLVSLVKVAGRPVVMVYADQLGDTLIATRRAEELTRSASNAFERIIQEGKGG